MKKISVIIYLLSVIFYTSCTFTDSHDESVWISAVVPNPANVNDTVSVAIKEIGVGEWIDSLNEVSIILTRGTFTQKQKVTGYSLYSAPYILGDFRNYDFLDTLSATKLIQFEVTDSTLTSSKVNVRLKDYLIKSEIVLTINK